MSNYIEKFREEETKFGKRPEERTIEELFNSGAIILDKDSGPTSHQEVDYLKKILNIKKIGHSGTLDPKVTGVLIVGLGKATRLMEYMLKSDKEYVCLMYIHKKTPVEKIKKTILSFQGEITQIPPLISAVKRKPRKRKIYKINILEIHRDFQHVLFRVRCERGTYIRKLCSDIGEKLGVGAQMKELRRTKAGPFREEDNIISLDKLRNLYELYKEDEKNKKLYEKELKKYIMPMENLLIDFKKVYVRSSAINAISCGSDLAVPGVLKLDSEIKIGEEIALMSNKGELIAMGISYLNASEMVKKKKGLFIKTTKVFMDNSIYPKFWKFKK